MNAIVFTFAAMSHKGLVREENQDNFYMDGVYVPYGMMNSTTETAGGPAAQGTLAVFDGMGGEAMGNFASHAAASVFASHRRDMSERRDGAEISEYAQRLMEKANDLICARSAKEGARIGTTLAMLVFRQDGVHAVNVGDSPVFRLRGKGLVKLTVDDTFTAMLVARGDISPKQAEKDPRRHSLTQHLGVFEREKRLLPHFNTGLAVKPGDRFLLCSDGLTDMVPEKTIASILADAAQPAQACRELVKAALSGGGRDNVTALTLFAEKA